MTKDNRLGSDMNRLVSPGLNQSRGQVTNKLKQKCSLCPTPL